MNEIEKLYRNVGIKKRKKKMLDKETGGVALTLEKIYPPFTAEKQLELIKWLSVHTYRNYFLIRYSFQSYSWQLECNMVDSEKLGTFDKALASLINHLWQDLTDADKAQIKEILE